MVKRKWEKMIEKIRFAEIFKENTIYIRLRIPLKETMIQ